MPKSKRPAKNTYARTRAEADNLKASFEKFYGVVDGAVTGAIIAGMHPYILEPVLSYWFLRCAWESRQRPAKEFESWIGDSNRFVLGTVIDAIIEFVHSYDGPLNDQNEEDEFNKLLRCLPDFKKELPSEFEQHKQSKQAIAIVEWALDVACRDRTLLSMVAELALLVAYLKASALSGTLDEEIYLTVKQSIPLVFTIYYNLLD